MKINKGDSMTIQQLPQQTQYDFSDEYLSKELNLGIFNGYPFLVTVQEIPHGKYTQLQKSFIGKMHLTDNEKDAKKQLREKEVDPIGYTDNRTLAGIREWTLKTRDGQAVPVCESAWNALPHRITEQIEKGIAELNPTLEDDFRGELAESSDSMGNADS